MNGFSKSAEKFRILDLSPDRISDILQIAESRFGKGYIRPEQLYESITCTDYISLVAMSERKCLGFSIIRIVDYPFLVTHFPKIPENIIGCFSSHHHIAYRMHTAVSIDSEHKGVGKMLVDYGIKKSKKLATAMFSVVWEHDENSIERILLRKDFHVLAVIPDYWYTESLISGYSCLICGKPPCRCKAKIMAFFDS